MRTVRNRAATSKRVNSTNNVVQEVQSRILSLLAKKAAWVGTMTDLNHAITTGLRRVIPSEWPSTPSVLRKVVNRVVPALKRAGVKVQFTRTSDHARKRFVSFSKN